MTRVDGDFDGAIDEVRVWSVARTQTRIAAARGAVVAPSDPSFSSLAGGATATGTRGARPRSRRTR